MTGFFTKEQTKSVAVLKSKSSCFSCGLYQHGDNPKMKPYGNFKKEIMIIGNFPGERDDANGKPWQGKEGRLAQRTLRDLGIDLYEDCLSLYAVNCLPKDAKPTAKEINYCHDVKVLDAIEKHSPKIIILLGVIALGSVVGGRWNKALGGMAKWRGWTIPDKEYGCWICPTYGPDHIIKMGLPEVELTWQKDLKKAVSLVDFPKWKEPNIQYITDLHLLDGLETKLAAFDYESTGIKPHFDGHRIVCASIAYDENNVYTFLMPKKKSLRAPFIRFLQNRKIKKIAANMKYETQWSNHRLKSDVAGWFHDTMLTAHQLDNRPGITGLKFQVYVRFGVVGYSDEVDEYITRSKYKGNKSNAINEIFTLMERPGGPEMLMKYCALDSIYEYRLALLQLKELKEWT